MWPTPGPISPPAASPWARLFFTSNRYQTMLLSTWNRSDVLGFYRQYVSNNDPGAGLVFADWLDEHDAEPIATFLRTCENLRDPGYLEREPLFVIKPGFKASNYLERPHTEEERLQLRSAYHCLVREMRRSKGFSPYGRYSYLPMPRGTYYDPAIRRLYSSPRGGKVRGAETVNLETASTAR